MRSNISKVKVGIIGFGLSGKVFHASLLKEHAGYEVTSVSSSRADDVHQFLPGVKVYGSASELIASNDVDLVINAAPNAQHFSLSAEALRAGKHVVVEKPFVNSSREGKKLIAIAEGANRFLSVYQNRRWDGDFLTVKDLIESGRLGEVQQFESHMDRWRPAARPERWREKPEPGSGILFDLGAHLIDQALILFGDPDSIWADIVAQRPGSVTDDYVHIVLSYGSRRVILHSSSFAPGTPRFQVFGSKASFVKFGFDPQEPQLRDEMSTHDPMFAREPESAFGHIQEGEAGKPQKLPTHAGRYLEFYNQLHSAIVTGNSAQLPVQPKSALRVIELIELARESSATGRVIPL